VTTLLGADRGVRRVGPIVAKEVRFCDKILQGRVKWARSFVDSFVGDWRRWQWCFGSAPVPEYR
jgi:hypothetical protein